MRTARVPWDCRVAAVDTRFPLAPGTLVVAIAVASGTASVITARVSHSLPCSCSVSSIDSPTWPKEHVLRTCLRSCCGSYMSCILAFIHALLLLLHETDLSFFFLAACLGTYRARAGEPCVAGHASHARSARLGAPRAFLAPYISCPASGAGMGARQRVGGARGWRVVPLSVARSGPPR